MMGEAALAKYGPIVFGLFAGSLAKFGRMLAVGKPIKATAVIGHLMMMVMVGMVAQYATSAAGITNPNAVSFFSAVFALAASDVIQWLAERAWLRMLTELITTERQYRGERNQTAQVEISAARNIDRAIEGELPADMQAQIDKLGGHS